jgi:hypothetical protein
LRAANHWSTWCSITSPTCGVCQTDSNPGQKESPAYHGAKTLIALGAFLIV